MAKSPNWSIDEISLLERCINLTHKEMQKLLPHRTVEGIQLKRAKLNLRPPSDYWTDQELQILQDNYQTLEDKEISALLLPHKSEGAINQKRNKLGLTKNNRWTPEDDDILRANYHKGTDLCCSLLPHHPYESLVTHANELGLKVDMSEIKRVHDFNRNYFTELTLENCYWAGFIAADGCVHDNGTLFIGLSIKDKDHLQKFADAIGYTGKIGEYFYAKEGRKDVHTVQLRLATAKQIAIDLEKWFNITPRKTKTLKAPTLLNLEQQIAFVAGYTDGDGSIGVYGDYNILRYSVIGGLSSVQYIKDLFDILVNCPEKGGRGSGCFVRLDETKYSFPFYRYSLNGKRAIKILQYIKQYPLPFLERKWGKVPTLDENKVI
jgi:hypothetical protein